MGAALAPSPPCPLSHKGRGGETHPLVDPRGLFGIRSFDNEGITYG